MANHMLVCGVGMISNISLLKNTPIECNPRLYNHLIYFIIPCAI